MIRGWRIDSWLCCKYMTLLLMGSLWPYLCCPSCAKEALLSTSTGKNILASGPAGLLLNNLKLSSGAPTWAESRWVQGGTEEAWEGPGQGQAGLVLPPQDTRWRRHSLCAGARTGTPRAHPAGQESWENTPNPAPPPSGAPPPPLFLPVVTAGWLLSARGSQTPCEMGGGTVHKAVRTQPSPQALPEGCAVRALAKHREREAPEEQAAVGGSQVRAAGAFPREHEAKWNGTSSRGLSLPMG